MSAMEASSETIERLRPGFGQPQLIFFSELSGAALQAVLIRHDVLDQLRTSGYGIALGVRDLSDNDAEIVRLLNRSAIVVIAWLLLPPGEGYWFNLQNYPQAVERYRAFHHWAQRQGLHFHAVGLDIEPPISELARLQRWGAADLVRRLWQARENVLFPAARAAYTDLIAEIHHDGYEVHTYQLPILADDRRAGTTLAQRALDIVDLPADVEVLICSSSVPVDRLGNDLGGALISSYGPAADSIGVGSIGSSLVSDSSAEGLPSLAWDALERDLLLAAHHTDTIYLFSLEGCVERGLMPQIARMNWEAPAHAVRWKLAVVWFARAIILVGLLITRFGRSLFAWLGWGLAAVLLIRQIRAWRRPLV